MTRQRTLLILFLLVMAIQSGSAEPILTHVDVFTAGEEGYHSYRIPAVESTTDGSLIAFAEARKHNLADPGMHDNDIDLVYKRSTDRGSPGRSSPSWTIRGIAGRHATPRHCWTDPTTGSGCSIVARSRDAVATRPGRARTIARTGPVTATTTGGHGRSPSTSHRGAVTSSNGVAASSVPAAGFRTERGG